ncbi:polysaccharide deacetylase [Thalassoporum mexicanum PCC 7367]|uniref:polysaccharide deacetylase family protein n=1 Tax=Thalassoporum mexicanum TaxID=3457544 RepID=UPI00029FBB32|nr:polysaccharide deacetylase family protein [Pseudanabaena sp. PCC 7367]AFY68722.1 polysaccharide deacetylase [Pseudanabaena sp. PCC 7367]
MQLAFLYPHIHQILAPMFADCLWSAPSNDRTQPIVALTFDDGPHPEHTQPLVEVLAKHKITASFFWLGSLVERSPQLAQIIHQQGHWLGIHGYEHKSFPFLSKVELEQSLAKTRQAIAQACSLDPDLIRDVRPPNGLFMPQTLQLLHQWQYRPVMWSIVPEDWVRPGIDLVVERVMQQVTNGSVIVLHDGYYGGEDVAATVDRLVPKLRSQGYEFVTIDQLWQLHRNEKVSSS